MNPIIIPINETKNFLDFLEINSKIKICVNKTDFIKAVEDFKVWRENLQATNFSSDLFRLMSHADSMNMIKILTGFPVRASVYLLWYHSDTEEEFWRKWGNVEIKDIEPIITNPESELLQEVKSAQMRQTLSEQMKGECDEKET